MFRYVSYLLILGLTFSGCTGKQGDTGPAGPQGNTGSTGPYTYQAIFQNGIYPTASYSGELDTWIYPNSPYTSAAPYLEVNTGAVYPNYARTLVRFNVATLPVNANVVSAEIILTTETNTTVGSNPVTIGLHNLASDTFSSCIWNIQADWGQWGNSIAWFNCTFDSSAGQEGYINPTTMSTVVFTSANNGKSQIFKWSIDPTVVQAWVAGTYNNGLILKSEGEFGEPTSTVDFFPYNGTTGSTAQLIVEYQ